MVKRRNIILRLSLQWLYKRHIATFAGVQNYAKSHGWNTVVDEFPEDSLPESSTQSIPFDGVIARVTNELARHAARIRLPVVNVWLTSPVYEDLPGVFPDFAAAGRLRAEHLLSRGLRRFALIIPEPNVGGRLEAEAFDRVIAEAGFQCVCQSVQEGYDESSVLQSKAKERINEWMRRWELPIGIFVYDDILGRQVAQMCQARGWRVPEDVAIVTGANEEAICEYLSPALTSIERGYERIGYEAAKMLDEMMYQRDVGLEVSAAPRHILIPPLGLVQRESTDFYAVHDGVVSAALTFIATNIHKQIGQDDVARAVAVGTRTLQRRFSKSLERSIAQIICHFRIERAKRELAQSDRLIKQIALDTGFGTSMRMYNTFLREIGISPTDYRNQWRKITMD